MSSESSARGPLIQTGPIWAATKPFVLGGSAGSLATVCIQPIDMIKVRLQLQEPGAGRKSPIRIAKDILKNEGFKTFYTGLSAGIFRQVTYGTARLGIFSTMSRELKDDEGNLTFFRRFVASVVAGGLGALVGTPADAALVRMQSDTLLAASDPKRRGYKHVGDALFRMAREEGVRGFFAGASPTIYRGLSVNIGMLTTYDTFREYLDPYLGTGRASHFTCGAMSGLTAATVSLPFDLIKTRMQRQTRDASGKLQYKNFLDCVRQTVAKGGVTGLWRGYPTYCLRIAPHITLTWVFLEALHNLNDMITSPLD